MSTRLRDVLFRELPHLRHEPTDKRIRAVLDGETVVDSTRALLVWEPGRVVPSYAVPVDDVRAELLPEEADGEPVAPEAVPDAVSLSGLRVLDPSIPFSVHTAPGRAVRVVAHAGGRAALGFRFDDDALAAVVELDFDGFDAWYEEDEPNLGHPRDPFHRIDIVRSSRHVRVELDGEVLAESSRPVLLFEPPLPVRYYLPPEDVRLDRLRPSERRSRCAYKGEAGYVSAAGAADVAWTYPDPAREASEVRGHYAFFNERVDLVVDGVRLERPLTPWS